MKPIWKNDELTVKLHKSDLTILAKAMALGKALTAMQQPAGPPLVEAIAAVLTPKLPEEPDLFSQGGKK